MYAINPRFIRFLLVGVLNTAFGYGCFAALLYMGMHYSLALFLATVLGIIFNFKTLGALVFRRSTHTHLLLRFIVVYGVVYLVNVGLLKGVMLLGVNAYVAAAILLLPVALLSYFLNAKFVFPHGQEAN